MEITVIGSTQPFRKNSKEEFDNFSGKLAGICYMKDNFNTLVNEQQKSTNSRVLRTKVSGHHSVYDHENINLYIEDIPKILAMVINNEKMYTTSEKSARYTKMVLTEKEQKVYNKWIEIYKKLIKDKYQSKYPQYFNDTKIEKLAQENARYTISVFTPTTMAYSVSYRQLNYLYKFMQDFLDKKDKTDIELMLEDSVKEFCKCIENTGYLDDKLILGTKNRELSLFNNKPYKLAHYFGDVYAYSYLGSFAQLAQAQRHRTISYEMKILDNKQYYIPKILNEYPELQVEWLEDCKMFEKNYPQGMLVEINEMGKLEDFILKMKERKCSFAQLEINNQTDETLNAYIEGLKSINHPAQTILEKYDVGSRCTFPDYKCETPCGFFEGITGERLI